jgi:RNA 2',3'-cyclic 3'-phosphodiesterase
MTLRLFAALPIPDTIAEQIGRVQRGLEGAKWSPRENLHVTLRFMGDHDVPTARDIDSQLGQIRCAPFELSLAGVGHFGGDIPHALWLGVRENPALLGLQKKCERACRTAGLAPDRRAYTPHVTVCYLPRNQSLASVVAYQQAHNLFASHAWFADRFYLYSSRTSGPGPSRFTIEAEYPLLA